MNLKYQRINFLGGNATGDSILKYLDLQFRIYELLNNGARTLTRNFEFWHKNKSCHLPSNTVFRRQSVEQTEIYKDYVRLCKIIGIQIRRFIEIKSAVFA